MKKTAKKFSLGVKIASILTCVVIAAAGFASWLIISPAEASEENGSFTVYTVDTADVTITVTPDVSTIIFGKTDDTFDNPWLVASDDIAEQVLKAEFTVVVASSNSSALLNSVADKIKVTFNIKDSAKTAFLAAMGSYIAAPKLSLDGGVTSVTYADGGISATVDAAAAATQTFTITVEFGWGTTTGGKNPFDYYNGKTVTSELAAEANTVLTAVNNINSYLEGLGEEDDKTAFTIKVETVSEESQGGN